jgi:hypothetical protein
MIDGLIMIDDWLWLMIDDWWWLIMIDDNWWLLIDDHDGLIMIVEFFCLEPKKTLEPKKSWPMVLESTSIQFQQAILVYTCGIWLSKACFGIKVPLPPHIFVLSELLSTRAPRSHAVNGEKCCGEVRPLVICCYIAIEAMAPVEIVDLSIKSEDVPVRKL